VPRRLRYFPERALVEVTARTLQGRFLLKPSRDLRAIFVGILARAAARYEVEVHAFVCAGNHLHGLMTPADAQQLAAFMRYLLTNLSKEAGRLHHWRGPLWQRRYQAILVSDEDAAQIGRLRYLLSHGVKEALVARVTEWPGAHCAAALMSGEPVVGVWYDRTRQHAARHRGEEAEDERFATNHRLDLLPLPCWRHLAPEVMRRRVAELVAEIESEAIRRHRQEGTAPLGVAGVLAQDPHDRPRRSKWSPAPLVHAASKRARIELRAAYYEFVMAFRAAAEKLRSGCRDVAFPEGCFPPSLPFCRSS
jgi:REP element-mobilizing transposase RayT